MCLLPEFKLSVLHILRVQCCTSPKSGYELRIEKYPHDPNPQLRSLRLGTRPQQCMMHTYLCTGLQASGSSKVADEALVLPSSQSVDLDPMSTVFL